MVSKGESPPNQVQHQHQAYLIHMYGQSYACLLVPRTTRFLSLSSFLFPKIPSTALIYLLLSLSLLLPPISISPHTLSFLLYAFIFHLQQHTTITVTLQV